MVSKEGETLFYINTFSSRGLEKENYAMMTIA